MDADTPLIRVVDASRVYVSGDSEIRALDHVSLDIRRGEFVAIMKAHTPAYVRYIG